MLFFRTSNALCMMAPLPASPLLLLLQLSLSLAPCL
jgi:hypothetical protein